jgi:hypothetical protein
MGCATVFTAKGGIIMQKLIKRVVVCLFILLISSVRSLAQGNKLKNPVIEYTDLGKFQVGLRGQFSGVDLPYFKPEGITQIPSRYFKALVIHQLIADTIEVKPIRQFFSSDESVRGIYITDTNPEQKHLSLQMPWSFSIPDYTNNIIKKGLFFFTSITGHLQLYNIPFGAEEISLIYSIRFLKYDSQYELIDTIESEKMGASWELEWYLPEPDIPERDPFDLFLEWDAR